MSRLMALCLAAGAFIMPPGAWGGVLLVDCAGGGNYLTVQEALDHCADGDTIRVAPCTYDEHVAVPAGRRITVEGAPGGAVVLTWAGSGYVIALLGNCTLTLRGVTVRGSSTTAPAIGTAFPDRATLHLSDATVFGAVGLSGNLNATNSRISRVSGGPGVAGGLCGSVFESCRVARARFSGAQFGGGYGVSSRQTTFGEIALGPCVGVTSAADSIGRIELSGGTDAWSRLSATGTRLGAVVADGTPAVHLVSCDISTVDYGLGSEFGYELAVLDCLVRERVRVSNSPYRSGWEGDQTGQHVSRQGAAYIEHTTILGDLDVDVSYLYCYSQICSSIVLDSVHVSTPWTCFIKGNDFAGSVDITAPNYNVAENIFADPLFCEPSAEDYALQDCSPCVGAGHDGGDIGAFGVGCQCWTPVEMRAWGSIKALFRQPSN